VASIEIQHGFPADRRDAVATLLRAYEASLGLSLDYQSFSQEIATLPGAYGPPDGSFAWAALDGALLAVVALRALDRPAGLAEMKRLYVTPSARCHGLGRRLAAAMLSEARRLGYMCVRLDTLPSMREAQALFRRMGFRPIAPYYPSPVEGTLYFERRLDSNDA